MPNGSGAMRFSGHESFACRYAWLPKAYRALCSDATLLADEERAMVELGVGKNMVRSIRFWVQVTNVAAAQRDTRSLEPTPFGHALLADDGLDPFLEDVRTLWLLHWHLSTHAHDPVFAWRFLISSWPLAELTRSAAMDAFRRESEKAGFSHSDVTLGQHLDVFLRTYLESKTAALLDDSLDGPLVELRLLEQVGEQRSGEAGGHEAVYTFRREPKPEITRQVFEYCLFDFWQQWHPTEATLTFRDVAVAPCSVGQVFKLPEDDIRERLENYAMRDPRAPFVYAPSAVHELVIRGPSFPNDITKLLRAIFKPASRDAYGTNASE